MSDTPPTRRQQPTPTPAPARRTPAQTRRQRLDTTDDTASLFPDRLRSTYEPQELLGTGTEGAVWRVRAGPAELALKVHWDNQPMDADLLDHLDNPTFHRHVPAIVASGRLASTSGTRDWVAMEYVPRTLEDLLADIHATPSDTGDTREAVIAELTRMITFWQRRIDRNPLDFKPANILVRPAGDGQAPGQFVIADFGGIHRFTASQAHGGASRFNLAYAPPEHTWSENATPWPWWGLGEIAYELATGHPRYRRSDGAVKADAEILRGQILARPDADIDDDRWRLLVRGLLTVDPDDRWGSEDVTAWLDGASPRVADPTPAASATPTRGATGVTFGRLELHDPAEIAAHMLDHGGDAARWLTEEGGATQLRRLLTHHPDIGFDPALLDDLTPERAAHAVTAFGAHVTPELTPTHRGRPVDSDGLAHLATTDPDHLHALLSTPAVLRSVALYHCDHAPCEALPRCDLIQRLAAEGPSLAATALANSENITTDTPDPRPSTTLTHTAHALATLAILTPDTLRTQVEQSRASALMGPHWWRRQVLSTDTDDTAAGRASMATTLLLADRATAERAATTDRQKGGAYARSVVHRTLAGLAAGLALVNATWSGMGSFPNAGAVLASVIPLIVAGSAALALWPWRTPETPSRVLTAACWTSAVLFAVLYRGAGLDPPDSAHAWWPTPDWLTTFMGLLPESLRVFPWWLQLLISTAVVLLSTKLVAFRMRLAYRQRYVNYWDAPRVGPEPEHRAGLAPLLAMTWLGLLTASAAAAATFGDDDPATLALLAPPVVYLIVFLAAGAGTWWLATRQRLALWGGLATVTILSAGWFTPLRLVEVTPVSGLDTMMLFLIGLGLTVGAALYLRTRLSPPALTTHS
ncbi:hypothetical protein J4H86_01645 [Spiractinospora alimapuensis]|uniref:protein kinase domain-containing protein n=1 Tax=Spiractinospora alimapuensis TaxID=2820884 RepID=UPI001F429A50|nr:hypothetical protein [Spiractinospora alimapuensis]QVQ52570.1 hypothetical protein J4H86_01645 [Spiractinospora alimapuensis]